MKVSTKGRYGLRTLMDIAIHQHNGPVTLKDVSARQDISAKYAWNIMTALKNAGIVRGTRGNKGGYLLVPDPSDVTLLDVVQILEGPVELVECATEPHTCANADTCVAQSVWQEVSRSIRESLKSITLADILRRHAAAGEPSNYVI
jgi:Rrf2 family transcriptional regulator, cysteine metabolism repressor